MIHCKWLGLLAVGLLATGLSGSAGGEKPKGHAHHDTRYTECAKACGTCAGVCDACTAHCAKMLAGGMPDHFNTLRTCQDCASVCAAAACITARGGPYSDTICTACAEVCKRCGDACSKLKEDDMMRRCAEECQKCEKACRDMLQHLPAASRESKK